MCVAVSFHERRVRFLFVVFRFMRSCGYLSLAQVGLQLGINAERALVLVTIE